VFDQAARAWARKPKRPLDRPLQFAFSVQAAADVAEHGDGLPYWLLETQLATPVEPSPG